jgi:hypothetical protein
LSKRRASKRRSWLKRDPLRRIWSRTRQCSRGCLEVPRQSSPRTLRSKWPRKRTCLAKTWAKCFK